MGKLRKILLRAPASGAPRLDHFLFEALPKAYRPDLTRAKIRKLILGGAVSVDRRRASIASQALRPSSVVELAIDEARLFADEASAMDRADFAMTADLVVYEDDAIIVVNKPFGVPTQPTLDPGRKNLFEELKRFRKERDGDEYVGLHHRLDRDTSGVILFTKTKDANPGVAEIFKDRLAQKTYHAVVGGRRLPAVGETWQVKDFLAKDRTKKGRMQSVRSGGDVAITDFRCLARAGDYALVEAKPRTGRMHQIRVHLAERGMPILGDVTYGGRRGSGEGAEKGSAPRVMLHAVALTFPHPISKLETSVVAPVPSDFRKCLEQHALTPKSHSSGDT